MCVCVCLLRTTGRRIGDRRGQQRLDTRSRSPRSLRGQVPTRIYTPYCIVCVSITNRGQGWQRVTYPVHAHYTHQRKKITLSILTIYHKYKITLYLYIPTTPPVMVSIGYLYP
jgi:hypothetical protein